MIVASGLKRICIGCRKNPCTRLVLPPGRPYGGLAYTALSSSMERSTRIDTYRCSRTNSGQWFEPMGGPTESSSCRMGHRHTGDFQCAIGLTNRCHSGGWDAVPPTCIGPLDRLTLHPATSSCGVFSSPRYTRLDQEPSLTSMKRNNGILNNHFRSGYYKWYESCNNNIIRDAQ